MCTRTRNGILSADNKSVIFTASIIYMFDENGSGSTPHSYRQAADTNAVRDYTGRWLYARIIFLENSAMSSYFGRRIVFAE